MRDDIRRFPFFRALNSRPLCCAIYVHAPYPVPVDEEEMREARGELLVLTSTIPQGGLQGEIELSTISTSSPPL